VAAHRRIHAMTVIRKFRDMDRKDREINEAAEKEIKQSEERKQVNEAFERERAEVRRLHKLGWRTADIAHQLKLSTDRIRLDVRRRIAANIAKLRELLRRPE
jgi:DNA-binding NarL/FixJ family response regulator